jgi:hypothetical protein
MARVLEKGLLYPSQLYGSPTYVSWNNMKTRCTSKANPKFVKNYQDRGISYCPTWKLFSNFLRDMGVRPEGTTLERKDNSRGYFKENCRWATVSDQNKNKRAHSNTGIKHITKYLGKYIVHVKPFRTRSFLDFRRAITYKNFLLQLRKENLIFKENSMILDQITFTKRLNEGNYCHSEVTLTATVEEGDDAMSSLLALKTLANTALNAKVGEIKAPAVEPVKQEAPVVEEAPKAPAKKKAKAAPVKEEAPVVEEVKDQLPSGQDIPPVIEEAKPKAKAAVKYSRDIEAHRNIFRAHLNANFPGWADSKPKETIKAFNLGLDGMDFLDSTSGEVVESFKTHLAGFFGA